MKKLFSTLLLLAVMPAVLACAATPDKVGLFDYDGSYFALLPQNIESSQDIRFQLGYSHSSFMATRPLAGNFDGGSGDTVGFFDYRNAVFYLAYSNNPGGQVDLTVQFG